ncbi:hypothetical protein O5286_29510, partial [Escherichia coli]|nr:hypothetical protein [Escherichia coli]
TFMLTQALLPLLLKSDAGSLVFLNQEELEVFQRPAAAQAHGGFQPEGWQAGQGVHAASGTRLKRDRRTGLIHCLLAG